MLFPRHPKEETRFSISCSFSFSVFDVSKSKEGVIFYLRSMSQRNCPAASVYIEVGLIDLTVRDGNLLFTFKVRPVFPPPSVSLSRNAGENNPRFHSHAIVYEPSNFRKLSRMRVLHINLGVFKGPEHHIVKATEYGA